MRECLLMAAIEDAPHTISINREELDKQREAKRKKEEMIETKSLGKAEKALVEASYYWDMYFLDVCWKGKQSIVNNSTAKSISVGTKNSRSEGFLLAKHKNTNIPTLMEPFSPQAPWL